MRGWVYVISNKAMPGLVKVGYTLKDPDLRAAELNHTGAPHPYVVDYEVMVDQPREIERKAHSKLKHKREGKEWFRCSAEHAIATIQALAGENAVTENFKRADRQKAAEIRQQKEREKQAKAKADDERRRLNAERNAILMQYGQKLRAIKEDTNNFAIYGGSFIAGLVVIGSAFPKASDMASVVMCAIFTWLVGRMVKSHLGKRAERSPAYIWIVRERDEKLASLEGRTLVSASSQGSIRHSPEVPVTSTGSVVFTVPRQSSNRSAQCPYCGEAVDFPSGNPPHSAHCPRCARTFFPG